MDFYVAKAMLLTVKKLAADLNQLTQYTSEITEITNHINLMRLIKSLENHTKNLELTLLEEIQLAIELVDLKFENFL